VPRDKVVIIGAGFGGLAAAALIAADGSADVELFEAATYPGGKARQLLADTLPVDAGPTVITLKPVLDSLFADCGADLDRHVTLTPASVLARHWWPGSGPFDLFSSRERTVSAVECFAGSAEARGFERFSAAAGATFETLDPIFIRAGQTNPIGLTLRAGAGGLGAILALRPYESLWKVLGEYFTDLRLRQLYARYATYCGSSPFQAPSTLMLIAHVEALGVWLADGGLSAIAAALAELAQANGARIHYSRPVAEILTANGRVAGIRTEDGERHAASAVIVNADPAAIASGRFGDGVRSAVAPVGVAERSLSAAVWLIEGSASGAELARHNVAFSADYPAEFRDIAAGRAPADPTIYLCALDRERAAPSLSCVPERFQAIMNLPATGDLGPPDPEETERWTDLMLRSLMRAGITLSPSAIRLLSPHDFETAFPSTGGALYGRASHGWAASFRRQGARTRIPGLYCAGGSTHPGAGVPMAVLSGRQAVTSWRMDRASTGRWGLRLMPGGMSTRSATAAPKG